MPANDPYGDYQLYDLEYEGLNEDIGYYMELAASAHGPVLELGCGSGRITIPMARAGAVIHGVDASSAMLAGMAHKVAFEAAEVQKRVSTSEQDWFKLEGPAKYPLVLLPFNAIHHCAGPAQVKLLFDGIRRSLLPGGTLAMDCYLPDPTLYRRKRGERFEERIFIDPRTGDPLTSWESGWYDDLAQVHHVQYIYQHADGREETVELHLRMFYPQELRFILKWLGWRIVYEASDFRGAQVKSGSLKWVIRLVPM